MDYIVVVSNLRFNHWRLILFFFLTSCDSSSSVMRLNDNIVFSLAEGICGLWKRNHCRIISLLFCLCRSCNTAENIMMGKIIREMMLVVVFCSWHHIERCCVSGWLTSYTGTGKVSEKKGWREKNFTIFHRHCLGLFISSQGRYTVVGWTGFPSTSSPLVIHRTNDKESGDDGEKLNKGKDDTG